MRSKEPLVAGADTVSVAAVESRQLAPHFLRLGDLSGRQLLPLQCLRVRGVRLQQPLGVLQEPGVLPELREAGGPLAEDRRLLVQVHAVLARHGLEGLAKLADRDTVRLPLEVPLGLLEAGLQVQRLAAGPARVLRLLQGPLPGHLQLHAVLRLRKLHGLRLRVEDADALLHVGVEDAAVRGHDVLHALVLYHGDAARGVEALGRRLYGLGLRVPHAHELLALRVEEHAARRREVDLALVLEEHRGPHGRLQLVLRDVLVALARGQQHRPLAAPELRNQLLQRLLRQRALQRGREELPQHPGLGQRQVLQRQEPLLQRARLLALRGGPRGLRSPVLAGLLVEAQLVEAVGGGHPRLELRVLQLQRGLRLQLPALAAGAGPEVAEQPEVQVRQVVDGLEQLAELLGCHQHPARLSG
mmetsp:Transcript_95312/g.296338  ORF Transcript_95312/g.296338 Transcript_95312/m.296338 type:complete len:415 (+) Transcript_95312:19-1263(+)